MYNKHLVFWSACLGLLLFGITLVTLGAVVMDLRLKFSLDGVAAGTLFSIIPIGLLTGSLLFGPISDRYGYKLMLILGCFGLCVSFQGIAHASGIELLKGCIFIFGLSGGVINGATNAVVADISTRGKGASLSLLGVSFGIGALGMPQVLAALKDHYVWSEIVSAIGWFILVMAFLYACISFPPAKQQKGFPLANGRKMFADLTLVLIGFFLFCQSSFETIIHNWATTYLTAGDHMEESSALYALSLYIAGMTVMRLLTGSVFRTVSPQNMLLLSLLLMPAGILLLRSGTTFPISAAGLILLGAGLAGGFPIMLGFVGERYSTQSGTAFSFVLVIALTGNMLVNYMMGLVVQHYGVQHLITVAFAEWLVMMLICSSIVQRLK
ncbi:MFS transporter [Chitinophaga sp. SYP-B3965]|uniref:MFS transporter n=1 Tax=Chitinophaga sp. SYP-B3965 TaxID=2663120 RepID=UPI001299F580|nr:MFS transporter [Chitinophaga sp. SYP-B3965]MRG48278.1 MFS transporter [Chitinophaga sp. SYP-B3965]